MSNGNAYVDRVWYSVIWKDTGKKYCDCGWEMDAQRIVSNRPHLLTYVRNDHYLYGQTVDVTPQPALPTNEIVVNMDGGVGGSWEERELEPATIKIEGQELQIQQSLPHSNQKPLDLQ
jgi:hypothetical protein|tara:strand:+ start:696 stop:1049 length:354 start_codon:yes stop_codon:yes gene_type:complete